MTTRRCSALLTVLLLVAAALAGLTLRPPAARAAGSPATIGSSGRSDTHVDGIGMLGYRLTQVYLGDYALHSITALSKDGRVAGLVKDPQYEVPQPFVYTPGHGFEELQVEDPGIIMRPAAFDPSGDVFCVSLDPTNLADHLVRWFHRDGGYYSKPVPVMTFDHWVADPRADISPIQTNSRGDLLLGGSEGFVVRANGGGVVHLNGGPVGATTLTKALPSVITDDGTVYGTSFGDPDASGPAQPRNELTMWGPGSDTGVSLGLPPGKELFGVSGIDRAGELLVASAGTGHNAWLRAAGGWRTLTTPDGQDFPAFGITAGGVVLGTQSDQSGNPHPASLGRDGSVTDWNTLLRKDGPWTLGIPLGLAPDGSVVGSGTYNGEEAYWLAQPVDPVVFVHGAGASSLWSMHDGAPANELWMDCAVNRDELSLFPDDIAHGSAPQDSGAVDVLRHETCFGIGEAANPSLDVYGTLLDYLRGSGSYAEYSVDRSPARETTAGCDLTQMSRHPNLFVYAYDWRRDNVDNAAGLADYLGCVQKFWPDSKVNIVTHSTGSLVARRYVLDHKDEHRVDRMITIGAPWLGAPKLVNVLETGDFAPQPVNGSRATIKRIVAGFPAAAQLMASRLYGDAASVPVFREEGWDINGDHNNFQTYDYDALKKMLNAQISTQPGATADAFQSYPGQTDWSSDDTGVKYTHIAGLQVGANTIGTVVARQGQVCSTTWYGDETCSTEQWIDQELVCGDGTVPLVSAERAGRGRDFNAPDAEVLIAQSTSTDTDHSAEHTGLTANPNVDAAIIERLLSNDPQPAADHSGLGGPGIDVGACTNATAIAQRSLAPRSALTVTAPEPTFETSLRYLHVLGATDLTTTDSTGATTDPHGRTAGYVNGVTLYPSDRDDAGMVTMPVSPDRSFATTFKATGAPVEISLVQGSQQHPVLSTKWTDVAQPAGTVLELRTAADGTDVLRADTDGDGKADTVIAPAVRVSGQDALDTTAPVVSAQKLGDGTVALTAYDGDGSGLSRTLWSTDGTTFHLYTVPLTLPDDATVTAFAEDRVGNRSTATSWRVGDLRPAVLTTAQLSPAPTGLGWSAGPVTVTFNAIAAGVPVSAIAVHTEGAQSGAMDLSGAGGTITVSAVGTTTVHFAARTADGGQEPERSVTVRVDLAAPTATVTAPDDGSVVEGLTQLSGTTADDASGVTKVEVQLSDAHGRSWDGSAWTPAATWLPTTGTTSWRRTSGLPSGADLPPGGYRLRVRVTDGAGRVSTAQGSGFTVAVNATYQVRELSVAGAARSSTATAVSSRGVAAGIVANGGSNLAVRWSAGIHTTFGVPAGQAASVFGVDDTGTVWGSTGNSTGSAAVQWPPTAGPGALPVPLPLLSVGDDSELLASERSGSYAAGREIHDGVSGPVRWHDGTVEALPLPPGASDLTISGVSGDGTVFGTGVYADGRHAVALSPGGARRLPQLAEGEQTSLAGVSSSGLAVGTETDRYGDSVAVLFADEATRLDSSFSTRSMLPHAVNSSGAVVGEYTTGSGQQRAFFARPGQPATDLTALLPPASGWTLIRANAIDDSGQIVGFGTHDGLFRAFAVSLAHAPVAGDVSVSTPVGTAVDVPLPGYDPDAGDSVDLAITARPAHGTVDVSGLTVRYTPAAGYSGADAIAYTLTDPGGLVSAPGVVSVQVGDGSTPPAPANTPPSVSLTAPATVAEGSTVTVTAVATDADGDPLHYSWTVDGEAVRGTGDSVQVAAGDGPADRVVAVAVSDGTASVARSATIHVTNSPPTVDAGRGVTTPWGVPATLTGTVGDPSSADVTAGLSPTWSFGDGATAPGTSAKYAWSAPGTYRAELAATDKDGGSASAAAVVTVTRRATTLALQTVDGPFGTARAAVAVSDGISGSPLAGRPVVVTVDGVARPAVPTGTDGTVTVGADGLLPGTHRVAVSVAADPRYEAASLSGRSVTVTQSAGKITGGITVAEGSATLNPNSDGTTVKGSLTWRGNDGISVTVAVTALGVDPASPTGWLYGTTADGVHRVLAFVQDGGEPGTADVFRIWVDGVLRTATGKQTAGNIQLHR